MLLFAATFAATFAAACSHDTAATHDRALQRARELYVAGDYEGARDAFRSVGPRASDPQAANLGLARSLQQLHEYTAAIVRYERVLEEQPGNATAWAGYLETLYQDGRSRGDGDRLEQVLALAPGALVAAPSRVEIYGTVLHAAAELDRPDEFAVLLEVVAEVLSEHAVVRIELARARINTARRAANATHGAAAEVTPAGGDAGTGPAVAAANVSAGDAAASRMQPRAPEQRLADLEAELRPWLAELEAGDGAAATASAQGQRDAAYALAVGYELLGAPDRVEAALSDLERTDEGALMAAPLRYRQFLDEWTRSMGADTATRLALADRWLRRFAPHWSNDAVRYRAVLGMQFDLLVRAARSEMAAQNATPSEERAEQIAATGRRLFRIDMGQRAARAVQTVSVLALLPSHYTEASRIAAEAADALRADAPGLLDSALREPERDEIRRRYLSVLLQIRGQALYNLGRDDDAESTLREAIDAFASAQSHAVLGGLLLDQGRAAEAYDTLVRALAIGFDAGQETVEEQTRASALAAAAMVGEPAAALDAAVAAAAARIAEERTDEIVADPLDVAAPDFTLDDLDGAAWTLSALAGRVVVINFWATWCGPCVAEMPHYQSLVDEYADAEDVVFLAISTDSDLAAVPRFMQRGDYDFTVLFDDGAAADFDISGVPATFIIGTDGLIKYRTAGFPGAEPYLRQMRLRIEALR